MAVEIEFMALPCPLPEAERQQLINFGVAALVARSNADARTTQTTEGQELADFESQLRDKIGVPHRRERFGCGGANASHP